MKSCDIKKIYCFLIISLIIKINCTDVTINDDFILNTIEDKDIFKNHCIKKNDHQCVIDGDLKSQNFNDTSKFKIENKNASSLLSSYHYSQSNKNEYSNSIMLPLFGEMQLYTLVHLGQRSGTPYRMVVDTGSAHTWVVGDKCKSSACYYKKRHKCNNSSTCKIVDNKNKYEIEYASGKLVLEYAYDNIMLQNIHTKNWISFPHLIGLAVNLPKYPFSVIDIDGILGIGILHNNESNDIINTLVDQLKINRHIVAIDYPSDTKGAMEIGGYENIVSSDKCVTWFDMMPSVYYAIKLVDIQVDRINLGFCESPENKDNCLAAIDTGTSGVGGSFRNIEKLLYAANLWKSCNNHEHLPTVTIVLSDSSGKNITFDLYPNEYVNEKVSSQMTLCPVMFQGISGVLPNIGVVLGGAFFKKWYIIIDKASNKIGLSKK